MSLGCSSAVLRSSTRALDATRKNALHAGPEHKSFFMMSGTSQSVAI